MQHWSRPGGRHPPVMLCLRRKPVSADVLVLGWLIGVGGVIGSVIGAIVGFWTWDSDSTG